MFFYDKKRVVVNNNRKEKKQKRRRNHFKSLIDLIGLVLCEVPSEEYYYQVN